MPAYLIGEFEVTNPAGLEPYRAANDTIAKYGGQFLVRGGATRDFVSCGSGART